MSYGLRQNGANANWYSTYANFSSAKSVMEHTSSSIVWSYAAPAQNAIDSVVSVTPKITFNLATGSISSGAITSSGNITAFSDERLKENIQTLDGKKVLQMRGVSFTKDGEDGSGVIAQELEKVAPELVHDGEKYKSVAYGNITGYLIEAIKDQQKEINELKTLVKQLLER